jgi:hypothetical protein
MSGTQIIGSPHLEVRKDGVTFEVVRGFDVIVWGMVIKIPAGWVTDFASVPRFFWRVLPPMGRYSLAAIAHDYLYWSGMVPKDEADNIFLELMKHLGVSAWKRNTMYQAVKLFGKSAWDGHRKNDATRKNTKEID